MRAPHRRVDEVADAGHNHARYERLNHQQQNAAENGEPLSDGANRVRSEIEETIEFTTSGYTFKIQNCVISVIYPPSYLQR